MRCKLPAQSQSHVAQGKQRLILRIESLIVEPLDEFPLGSARNVIPDASFPVMTPIMDALGRAAFCIKALCSYLVSPIAFGSRITAHGPIPVSISYKTPKTFELVPEPSNKPSTNQATRIKMPVAHLGINTEKFEEIHNFYVAALKPLGYAQRFEFKDGAVRGYGPKFAAPDFWISTAPTKPEEVTPGNGGATGFLHYAFSARTRNDVRAFYDAAM